MAQPKCLICGRFMRRLKLIERIQIELSEEDVLGKASKRTYICKAETFSLSTAVWEHKNME